MMALMHEARPYGHLVVGERRLSESDLAIIAQQCGALGGAHEVKRLLGELRENGVYSVADDGTIISRRMVRDYEKRALNKTNGKLGGERSWGPSDGLTRKQREARAKELGTHTAAQWERLKDLCGRKCVLCGTPEAELDGATLCKDHITPISLGGSDAIDNLQPACRQCNTKKKKSPIDGRPEAARSWATSQKTSGGTDPDSTVASLRGYKPNARAPLAWDGLESELDLTRQSPSIALGAWFVREGVRAGAIPAHHGMDLFAAGYATSETAEALLATWPLDEIKARARRFLARKLVEGPNRIAAEATLGFLSRHWEWFAEDAVAAGDRGSKRGSRRGESADPGMPRVDLGKLR